mmetsp:Transcript_1217/g.1540  ORF Transcript_1217/g.1540 Transcript_1217/m.1540 type:complete len:170 (-) Transcript_1217:24-533(-)
MSLISDSELMSELGMKKMDVKKFRRLVKDKKEADVYEEHQSGKKSKNEKNSIKKNTFEPTPPSLPSSSSSSSSSSSELNKSNLMSNHDNQSSFLVIQNEPVQGGLVVPKENKKDDVVFDVSSSEIGFIPQDEDKGEEDKEKGIRMGMNPLMSEVESMNESKQNHPTIML